MSTLKELLTEKCPNCNEVGTSFEPPQGKMCTVCLKPWIKPKPYALYILLVTILICACVFGIHLMIR